MKILLISILLLTTTLFANIGKISALSGEVTVSRDSKTIPATIGFALEEKDTIATTANARVQLLFNDKTVISLGKNSTFDIEEYFYDTQKPNETKASFKAAKGIFKTITGQIGKVNPNKFTLKTRSASIGIRGTIFFGDVPQEPTQPEIVTCTDGIIEVSTPQGIQQVGANQFTSVSPNQAPTPPQDAPPAQINNAQQNSGASENEQESGYDEDVFYESNTPTGEVPNVGVAPSFNNDPQEFVDDNKDNTKNDIFNQIDNSLHYINTIEPFIALYPGENPPFSYEFITNDSITSILGTGSIMEVTDGADTGFSWGFWSSTGTTTNYTAEKVWVLSDKSIVSDLSSLTSADNANYNGKIMGYSSSNGFIDPTYSTIELIFDFGAGTTGVYLTINGGNTMPVINGTYTYNGANYKITGGNGEIFNGKFYNRMLDTAGTGSVGDASFVYTATSVP